MNRTPPFEVTRALRKEVGFGCPVPGCGNPYLYWAHFDPPWREKQHHNPEGMIALCAEHHAKADAGAYTKEQLRDFKRQGMKQQITGRFDWMRQQLLGIVGGDFYYKTPVLVQFRDKPVIWFNRDEDGYILVNIEMITISGEPRMRLENNFWISEGDPMDLVCPPSGKLLEASYVNGDMLRVEFMVVESAEKLKERYPHANPGSWNIPFPITAVEVSERVGGTQINFGPEVTQLYGQRRWSNFIQGLRVGLRIR